LPEEYDKEEYIPNHIDTMEWFVFQ
jgi:hypothetical protein